MKLYQFSLSPNCQKVVAVAHEVGLRLDLVDVELFKGGAKTPLSAAETAEALCCSLSSANSTLHRARAALEERVGPRAGWSPEDQTVDFELLERYMRAWEHGDLAAVIALLHDDVTLSMPPSPTWIDGRANVARFFTNRTLHAVHARRFSTARVDANGLTSVGFYRPSDDGLESVFFALQVIEAKDGLVRVIDHFMSAGALAAFFAGGLARTLPLTRAPR